MITLHAFSFACWSYFSLCCLPPHFFFFSKGNIISSFRNTHRKWVSICWLLASDWALTGGEYGCSPPRFICTFPPEQRINSGCTDQRGFCIARELEEEIGHCASSWGTVIQGAVMGSARHVAAVSEDSVLTAQRAGCLLKMNAPSTASNDSFAVNHFQKWIATVFLEWTLWNPSLIMAGFQLVVLSEFLKIKTKPPL